MCLYCSRLLSPTVKPFSHLSLSRPSALLNQYKCIPGRLSTHLACFTPVPGIVLSYLALVSSDVIICEDVQYSQQRGPAIAASWTCIFSVATAIAVVNLTDRDRHCIDTTAAALWTWEIFTPDRWRHTYWFWTLYLLRRLLLLFFSSSGS